MFAFEVIFWDKLVFWDRLEFTSRDEFVMGFACWVELITVEEFEMLEVLVVGISWEEFVAVALDCTWEALALLVLL